MLGSNRIKNLFDHILIQTKKFKVKKKIFLINSRLNINKTRCIYRNILTFNNSLIEQLKGIWPQFKEETCGKSYTVESIEGFTNEQKGGHNPKRVGC